MSEIDEAAHAAGLQWLANVHPSFPERAEHPGKGDGAIVAKLAAFKAGWEAARLFFIGEEEPERSA